jgi:hypothetical protein
VIRNALEGTTVGGSLLVVLDVTMNSADFLLMLSDYALPIVAMLVGDYGSKLGVDQGIATNALLFVGTLFLANSVFKLIDKVKDET